MESGLTALGSCRQHGTPLGIRIGTDGRDVLTQFCCRTCDPAPTTGKVAYCAPGRLSDALLALIAASEAVAEVSESAILTGYMVIIADLDRLGFGPAVAASPLEEPMPPTLGPYRLLARYGALINRPMTFPVTTAS